MNTPKSLIAASLTMLLLAACGSTGIGDVLGGGGGGSQTSNYEIRGTVESVDSQSVWLRNVSGYTSMLSNSGSGNSGTARVYFDNQTTVDYQGQAYRPQDLERGDEVVVRVDEDGNRLIANSMTVTYNAGGNTSSSYPSSSGAYGSTVRGTVRYVDASRGTLEIDRGSGMSTMMLDFDTATPVYFNGNTYRVADLERGDEVEIRVRETGGNRVLAQDVTVVRSVSGGSGTYGGSSTSNQYATIRGTVRSIDTSRRTFELESANWISGFNTGAGTGVSRITVQYSDSMQIDVNGRLHPMAGLERGDVVNVQVSRSGSAYWAERVTLVHDINNSR
jgi:bifunctional DNA-binding transcriptional regulator/antitoxin component of YhaV-PrlF toxin-antitoxin module